ncbi:MAG: nitroreductase family protein [Clostridia bacterium]
MEAIYNRRSIRKYILKDVPKEIIEQILQAGTLAPSSKNRQPWKFVVVAGSYKNEMLSFMKEGLLREKNQNALLPNSAQYLKAAEYTLEIMTQAPVSVFAVNCLGVELSSILTPEERIYEICNAQSIGAALENMTLTATELGLGSLWICDIFFAHQELNEWLGTNGQLVAAMTFGYADEHPNKRPRKNISDIVEWRL